jgi:hypothetical protein
MQDKIKVNFVTCHAAQKGQRSIALPPHNIGSRSGKVIRATPPRVYSREGDSLKILKYAGLISKATENLAHIGIGSPYRLARSE